VLSARIFFQAFKVQSLPPNCYILRFLSNVRKKIRLKDYCTVGKYIRTLFWALRTSDIFLVIFRVNLVKNWTGDTKDIARPYIWPDVQSAGNHP